MDSADPERVTRFVRQEVGRYLAGHPEDRYPASLVGELARLGALGATVPAEFGGGGWSRRQVAVLGYELGRAWQPLAGLVGTHLKLCRLVLEHGTPEQRGDWLGPMARGAAVFARAYHEQGLGDPAGLRTRAVRRGPVGVLSGRKNWVTNARDADRVLAVARSGASAVGVLVDPGRPGVTVGPELPRPGMLGVSLAEITFDDYEFDPEREVLGGWGHDLTGALRRHDVTSYAARAVGSADAVVEHALGFVRATLSERTPEARGAVRLRAGELVTRLAVMRAVWEALLEPAAAEAPFDPAAAAEAPGRIDSATAKVFCTEALQEIVRVAAVLCGGAGYAAPDGVLGRHYRDALALVIVGAPNDVLLSRLGGQALGVG
ncbi:acyl-CoA dehydrogenase family protein [Kitasatospora sp. NPDC089509]|uniref:acyl-CoA dehydrogenase family protein n=1 Tax=Kitasatospora sp. NPDC089509 TaxID=3364079 RepID=UPI0037F21E63